jgi:hypothetical protein
MNAKSKAVVVAAIATAVVAGYLLLPKPGGAKAGSSPERVSHATVNSTRSSVNSSRSVSRSGNARLASRSALLINQSPLPMMQAVAERLAELLTAEGVFESIRLESIPALETGERSLANGSRGPDVYLRLGAEELEAKGLLTLKVRGLITLSMGTAPWASNHHHSTHSSPPVIDFRWDGRLDYESEIKGVATDRKALVAQNIAMALAETLAKEMKSLRDDHDPLPLLPDSLYGSYRPAPELELPSAYLANEMASYSSLLAHNQTFWIFKPEGEVTTAIKRIRADLERAGWKQYDFTLGTTPYLRMTRADATLSAFPARNSGFDPGRESAPPQLVLHYEERFTDVERENAINQLCSSKEPLETLLLFSSMMSSAQRDQFQLRILETPHRSPQLYLHLAEQFTNNEKERAIMMLDRAEALLAAYRSRDDLRNNIRTQRKKLTGKEDGEPVSADLFREIGFRELKPGDAPAELVQSADEPACFFTVPPDGKPVAFCLRVTDANKIDGPSLISIVSSDGMRSESSRGGSSNQAGLWSDHIAEGLNDVRFEANVVQLESGGYRFSARVANQ